MAYKLLLSDEAKLDILDAYSWYEFQRKGLGWDFELCIEASLNSIQRNPISYQKKYREIHICYISRFPYGIT